MIGRWMENEFLAVLMECGDDEVARVGERLRKMANQCMVEWWGDQLSVTISMGGTGARTADTLEAMLSRAENGLRTCSEQGGNRVVLCEQRSKGCETLRADSRCFRIIGIVVVFGAVLAGYLMEHGNLRVLMQPAELIIILGAAIEPC